MMHPIIHEKLNNARISDLHRRAEQHRLARAVSQAGRARQGTRQAPGGRPRGQSFARRLQIILGARSVWPERAMAWARSRW